MKNFFKKAWVFSYPTLILVLLAAASFFVSYLPLSTESLRLDESQSIWQTSHSLKETLHIVAQDVHMPLYHIIFHYWTFMFGDSVEIIRLLSFIFFIASFPFIYLLGRTVLTRPWALTVVGLLVLSPFANWYANEARMYTLLGLMSVISQYLFIRIMQGKKNSWPWYVVVSIIGAYSHYFFMFNLMAQAVFFLFTMKKFPKKSLRKFIGTAIAVGVAISPWIIYFVSLGAAGNTRPNIPTPTPIDFFNVYSQFLFGFQSIELNTVLISLWPLLVVVALVMVRRFTKPNMAVNYIVVAAFIPVLIAFSLSFVISPFFLSRYMIAAVVPLYILIIWIISRYSRKVAIITLLLIALLTAGLYTNQVLSNDATVRENFKTVVADISKEATPSDVIVMSSPFTVYPFEYYYKGTTQIRTLPIWDRQNPGPVTAFNEGELPQQVNTLKESHDYIYLVLSYDQGYETEVRTYFRDNFELVGQKTYSPELELLVYRVGYENKVQFTRP